MISHRDSLWDPNLIDLHYRFFNPIHLQVFKAAQPALLYLVPFTLLPLFLMAYLKGDLRTMWHEPFAPPPKAAKCLDI